MVLAWLLARSYAKSLLISLSLCTISHSLTVYAKVIVESRRWNLPAKSAPPSARPRRAHRTRRGRATQPRQTRSTCSRGDLSASACGSTDQVGLFFRAVSARLTARRGELSPCAEMEPVTLVAIHFLNFAPPAHAPLPNSCEQQHPAPLVLAEGLCSSQ